MDLRPGSPSALSQGAAIVSAVVERERSGRDAFTAGRLAERTGIERSRVSRLTQELVELGFLQREDGAVLRAGAGYFRLAGARQERWLRAARAEIRRLASEYRACVKVFAPDGARAVLLRFEAAPGAPETATVPGMVVPVWCTGGGRALLWEDSPEDLAARLETVGFAGAGGPSAVMSVDELRARMDRDRERGFVVAAEEFEHRIAELAAPVRHGGRVIAAVSAAVHIDDAEGMRRLGPELLAIASALEEVAAQ